MKRKVFKENKKVMREYQNKKIIDPECTFLLFKNRITGLLHYDIIIGMDDVYFTLDEYYEDFENSSIVEITRGERYYTVEIEDDIINDELYIHLHFVAEDDSYGIEEDDFYVIEE